MRYSSLSARRDRVRDHVLAVYQKSLRDGLTKLEASTMLGRLFEEVVLVGTRLGGRSVEFFKVVVSWKQGIQ